MLQAILLTEIFNSADTSPRKAHKVSLVTLDDQARMELLVRGFNNIGLFQEAKPPRSFPFSLRKSSFNVDTFKLACSWPGVFCIAEDQVKRINFSRTVYEGVEIGPKILLSGGSIDLSSMPTTVLSFKLDHQEITGTVDTAALPRGLLSMQLTDNAFHGEFNVSSLPPALVNGHFNVNKLSGPIDLTDIPPNVQLLSLANNAIVQEIVCVGTLSSRLVAVDLKGNSIDRVLDESGEALVDERIIASSA